MTEYDMHVVKHLKSQDAAKTPEFKAVLECDDPKMPKMRLSVKSGNPVLFQEYPLGRPVTVRIEAFAQTKLNTEVP